MDLISELPDDLLLRILSLVHTKTAFDAQLLSKRWRNLWRVLPSLYYDSASHKSESHFSLFIHRTMELLESPVLDSLFIRFAPTKTSSVVYLKSDLLAKRTLRELDIVSATCHVMTFKKAIYQFQELVIFRLEGFSLEDDCGDPISLKSLKVLKLCRVKYSSDESLSCLLSNLPSLKDLTLDRCSSGKQTTTLSIAVPGLLRLTFLRCSESSEHDMMLNVNAPCLEYLELEDYWRDVSISDDKKMEKLVEADVSVVFIDN